MQWTQTPRLMVSVLTSLLAINACHASGGPDDAKVEPKIQTVKPKLPDSAQALIGRVFEWHVMYPETGPAIRPESRLTTPCASQPRTASRSRPIATNTRARCD